MVGFNTSIYFNNSLPNQAEMWPGLEAQSAHIAGSQNATIPNKIAGRISEAGNRLIHNQNHAQLRIRTGISSELGPAPSRPDQRPGISYIIGIQSYMSFYSALSNKVEMWPG